MSGNISNGFFAKQKDYSENGNIGVVCVGDVVNRKYTNVSGLRRTNASPSDIQKYGLKYGDLLFCRSSLVKEGIGKASIVPKHAATDIVFECHVIRVSLNISRCVPEFMQAQTSTDYFRNLMFARSKTATMTTIGQDAIENAAVIVPPLALQEEYVFFASQSDKSKLFACYANTIYHIVIQKCLTKCFCSYS